MKIVIENNTLILSTTKDEAEVLASSLREFANTTLKGKITDPAATDEEKAAWKSDKRSAITMHNLILEKTPNLN